jgi:hypothetical protein
MLVRRKKQAIAGHIPIVGFVHRKGFVFVRSMSLVAFSYYDMK